MNIKDKLSPLITDIQNPHFSLQTAFDRNLKVISALYEEGYQISKICEIVSEDYEINTIHFRNLLHRARKKTGAKHKQEAHQKTGSKPRSKESLSEEKTKFTELDWRTVNVHSTRLMKDLESYNLTPKDVRAWGLHSSFQIRNKLGHIQHTLERNP